MQWYPVIMAGDDCGITNNQQHHYELRPDHLWCRMCGWTPDELSIPLSARIAWLQLMGLELDEIVEHCRNSVPTDLEEELHELEAAKHLRSLNERRDTIPDSGSDHPVGGLD